MCTFDWRWTFELPENASIDKFCPKFEQKLDEPDDFLGENLIFMHNWCVHVLRNTVQSENVSFGEVATYTRVSVTFGFLQIWLDRCVGYGL